MDLTDELMRELTQRACGSQHICIRVLSWTSPITPAGHHGKSLARFGGIAEGAVDDADHLRDVLKGMVAVETTGSRQAADGNLEALVEGRLEQPTYITEYPAESPLARRNDKNSDVTDRFELFIGGEYANGFSELNDPVDQAARFKPGGS